MKIKGILQHTAALAAASTTTLAMRVEFNENGARG